VTSSAWLASSRAAASRQERHPALEPARWPQAGQVEATARV
jgi:hypothetical protein